MSITPSETSLPQERWSLAHKVGFRLLFVWIMVLLDWSAIPYLGEYIYEARTSLTLWFAELLDIACATDSWTGTGDRTTSYVLLLLSIVLAIGATIVWSILDKKRHNYSGIRSWFTIIGRYYLCLVLFVYGFSKILVLQMPPPTLAELATPYGYNSMGAIAWNFIGASPTYEIFTGILEVVAGLLLLSRRTTFFGSLLAFGVLINVAAINFCYGIPVKIYSSYLAILAVYLLSKDVLPLWRYLVLRKAITAPQPESTPPRWSIVVRLAIVAYFFYATGYTQATQMSGYLEARKKPHHRLYGNYDVLSYTVNGVPFDNSCDLSRWNQFVIGEASDSLVLSGLIRKGFQDYLPISLSICNDSTFVVNGDRSLPQDISFHYTMIDSSMIVLDGSSSVLSMKATLRRSSVVYPYNKYKFRWIIE